ncbi:MAG: butyrate kinase [Candidatus Marinimicrobia bacterium]|nr:butyrate kinase [Candidatus Neomarinimicrobiota bacterium]
MKLILTINPGSTTTKMGVFNQKEKIYEFKVEMPTSEISKKNVATEFPYRKDSIERSLKDVDLKDLVAVVGRGGLLKPLKGGVYRINDKLVEDLKEAKNGNHASNLGAMLADYFGKKFGVQAFIIDPVTIDELEDVARISGVPSIKRISRAHALNIKATTRKICDQNNWNIEKNNFVVAHLGGGISICALKRSRMVDVNDALIGMGPFSPERAGALPLRGVMDLAYSGEYTKKELELLFIKNSGLKGYLGTNDGREVSKRIKNGDKKAKLIFDAMIYQIQKEIGAMLSVCDYNVKAIIITGGLAHNKYIQEHLTKNLDKNNVIFFPGENELEAMADGGFRAIDGKIEINDYK